MKPLVTIYAEWVNRDGMLTRMKLTSWVVATLVNEDPARPHLLVAVPTGGPGTEAYVGLFGGEGEPVTMVSERLDEVQRRVAARSARPSHEDTHGLA